nr:integrin alpha-X-like [Chelonoidis abingdonii]
MKQFIGELLRALAGPRVQIAVVQFSSDINHVFTFADYAAKGLEAVEQDLMVFSHLKGNTRTPSAILFAVEQTFAPKNGARPHAKKLLLVLTDGQSTEDSEIFHKAIRVANNAGLVRYAIGVGNAFSTAEAHQELLTIASRAENVFQVGSFSALSTIQEQLREKIFAIEGTAQVSNASSFQLELSQGGFSALLTSEAVVVGAVGAYDWAGGLEEWSGDPPLTAFINESSLGQEAKDSYLGYALAMARRGGRVLYVAGAPRFGHVGRVGVFQRRGGQVGDSVLGEQVGSSFGAELCTLDLDGDGDTDLVLIGAPGHQHRSRGGLVRVCALQDGVSPGAMGPCLEDFLTPVELQVNFSVQGEPIPGTRGLTPLLLPSTNTTTHIQVPFEKNCGLDEVCVADLRVSFNFSGSPGLSLRLHFPLDLTVQLENAGEMAYGPVLTIQYPPGLSFRGGSVLQSHRPVSLVCDVPRAPGRLSELNSSCQLSPPALRGKTKVFLRLSFHVSSVTGWEDDPASFTVRAACQNENGTLADNAATLELPVLRPVGVVVTGLESSTYISVSSERPERRAIAHRYQVQNLGPPTVPVTVTFELPIRAELGFLWDVSVNLSGGEQEFTCTPPLTLRMGTAAQTPKEPVTRVVSRRVCLPPGSVSGGPLWPAGDHLQI